MEPSVPDGRREVTRERFDAVLLDLDGVITDTARIHTAAWKEMFDAFLRRRAEAGGEAFRPFDPDGDYRVHVDGKPRFDGVRDFLASREIRLPEGAPDDLPDAETVHGLGNRKDELVNRAIASQGVESYPGTVAWLHRIRGAGMQTAVVSSSSNCAAVLEAAKLSDLFDTRVDGLVIVELGIPGKPAPDSFLEAARRLGVAPARAVVVEDALSGVRAGRTGGFGLVIGVARKGDADALAAEGADLVVEDLAELLS